MAFEQRLIDANELVSILEEYATGICYEDIFSLSVLKRIIGERKTVDAVEVVRCKDCKNYVKMSEQDKEFRCNVFCGCYDRPYPTGPNDFCSYGERRTA